MKMLHLKQSTLSSCRCLLACLFCALISFVTSVLGEEKSICKRAAVIGDSVVAGYLPNVQQLLANNVKVVYFPLSDDKVLHIDEFTKDILQQGPWDVVYISYGTDVFKTEGGMIANDYYAFVEKLLTPFWQNHMNIIWSTTVPIPERTEKYKWADVKAYNDMIKTLVNDRGADICDLYEYVRLRQDDMQVKEKAGLNKLGDQLVGEVVANKIMSALQQDNKDLPYVLILGDSICNGYYIPVRSALIGKANVYHGVTEFGRDFNWEKLIQREVYDRQTKLGKKFTVIHFNWGLHALKYVDNDNKLADAKQGKQCVPPDEYRKELENLVIELKKTGSMLIWASTTQTTEKDFWAIKGQENEYNRVAEEIMKKHNIITDDLHSFIKDNMTQEYIINCHYTAEGSNLLAQPIAKSILGQLNKTIKDDTPASVNAIPELPVESIKSDQWYLKPLPESVEQFRNMRFGIMICWSPVVQTGDEISWSRKGIIPGMNIESKDAKHAPCFYDDLYTIWRPEKFDANEWMQVIKDSGAQYVIPLAKHHDGFCMFDSKLTDYKLTGERSAWKVDYIGEIARACHEKGVKLVIYYSQPDWHHPDYMKETHHEKYIPYLHGQLRELLTNYGRVEAIWFDGYPFTAKDWESEKLFKIMREIQPHILINNRCGLQADWDSPEQAIGAYQTDRLWEAVVTMARQWGWRPGDVVKSLKDCIDIIVTAVGRDGNIVLNIGPRPDGSIEPEQKKRCMEIGKWFKEFGYTIYGTRGGPFQSSTWGTEIMNLWGGARGSASAWGTSTRKDNKIYLHLLNWPNESVILPPINAKIISHKVLTGGSADIKQTDAMITVSVPQENRHKLDTIVELTVDRPAMEVQTEQLPPSGSLAYKKSATASSIQNQKNKDFAEWFAKIYGPNNVLDDNPFTRWSTDWYFFDGWLEIDLQKETEFNAISIQETYGSTRQFELQAKKGDQWVTFYKGTDIGPNFHIEFEPVKAQYIKLNIIKADWHLSISEFQVFNIKNNN
jgi:alpha-L-fucosidase